VYDLLLVELFNAKYYPDLDMLVKGHWKRYVLKAWVLFPIHIPQ